MELEFYQELLLTAVFSVLIAFLIGKIAVIGSGDGGQNGDANISSDLAAAEVSREKLDRSVTEPTPDDVHLPEGSGADEIEAEENATAKMPEIVEAAREDTDFPLAVVEGGGDDVEEGPLLHGEDEWEGIERSELEKVFSLATEFVGSRSGARALSRLSSDLQMEIYGLNKVATEGPCYSSQPLPLNFSARAKWQAWQRLGNMSPDAAMEQYISLLSKNIPGWMDENSVDDGKHDKGIDFPEARLSDSGVHATNLSLQDQICFREERKMLDSAHVEIGSIKEGSKILETGMS